MISGFSWAALFLVVRQGDLLLIVRAVTARKATTPICRIYLECNRAIEWSQDEPYHIPKQSKIWDLSDKAVLVPCTLFVHCIILQKPCSRHVCIALPESTCELWIYFVRIYPEFQLLWQLFVLKIVPVRPKFCQHFNRLTSKRVTKYLFPFLFQETTVLYHLLIINHRKIVGYKWPLGDPLMGDTHIYWWSQRPPRTQEATLA